MVYTLTAIFLLLCSYIVWDEQKNRKEGRTQLFLLLAVVWFILHDGLRWEIGTDWEPYYNVFMTLDSNHVDIGYLTFVGVFRFFTRNYTLFLLFYACITYYVLYKTVDKYSCNPLMSLCIYYCSMLGLLGCNRHILAMFICMYSIKYVFNRNLLGYIICVTLAISMHKVAVFFLPVYFLYRVNISAKYLIIFVLVSFIAGNTDLMYKIPFSQYFELIDNFASASDLETYMESDYADGGIMGSLKRLLFVIPGMLIRDKVNSQKYNFFLLLYSIGCVLYLISIHSPLNFVLGRAGVFFTIYEIIIIPYIFKYLKINNVSKYLIWLFIFVTYYIKMDREIHGFFMLTGVDIYNPYKCVLFI